MATPIPSSPPLPSLHDPPSPTSSEPPIFSSDDPLDAEEATNYISPRFKRKRAGPWWNADSGEASQTLPKKSKLSRNFDSGVWMLSDDSQDMEEQRETENIAPQVEADVREKDPVESLFMDMISHSQGQHESKTYSLNEKGLRDEDLSHLVLLNQMVAVPGEHVGIPDENSYRPFMPEIILHLESNSLRFPGPTLFDVDRLYHLNLSHNNIEEIPPAISKLSNLRSLNLTHNKLRWLPFEILEILRPAGILNSITLLGNPLVGFRDDKLEGSLDDAIQDMRRRIKSPMYVLAYHVPISPY